jgi:tetratricopeptide (TPR) repeat protein
VALAEAAEPHLRGPDQSAWMARLAADHENIVAAAQWCNGTHADAGLGLRLAAATGRYWLFNDVELGCRMVEAALERDRDAADSPARLRAQFALATMYMHRGLGGTGLPHARAALDTARRLASTEWQAMALNAIGTCVSREDAASEVAQALRYHEQARDLAEAGGHLTPLSAALNNIACIEFRSGRLDSAERGYRHALHLSRAQGDVRSTLIELHNLVRVLLAAGRPADARACVMEAELLLRGVGEQALKLELLDVTGCLASCVGAHRTAARLWGYALHRFTQAGYQRPPEDEAQLARWSAVTREALGDAAFCAAQAEGRTLTLDAAMNELRRWLEAGSPSGPAAGRARVGP